MIYILDRGIVDMDTQPLTKAIKRQYDYSLTMLREVIDACPENLWTERIGLFPFWQQIYHSLYWADYNIQESYAGEKIFSWKTKKVITHELNKEKFVLVEHLTKDELCSYFQAFIEKKEHFFYKISDTELLAPIPNRQDDCTYLDIITNQIRHIMYHVGHCDCALREQGCSVKAWVSIYGRWEDR